jgi:hypothetical protein
MLMFQGRLLSLAAHKQAATATTKTTTTMMMMMMINIQFF